MTSTAPTILISGASIAGPALAYWLHRYGFAVTVVEKAGAPRGGGYPIDVRGTAIEVAERMGILPQLREAHVDSQRLTFLDADGSEVASLSPHTVAGSVEGRDLEVTRGDLAAILHATTRDNVEYVFNDAISTLDESADGIDITFQSGARRTFDLVVGADGMHSHTRELLFGPEAQFHRHLGYRFAVFTMPNTFGLSHELLMWNAPGRAAALYATGGEDDRVHAFLNVHRPVPHHDSRAPADLLAEAFAGSAWQLPTLIEAMHQADDLFSDTVGQIHMPTWSKGRAVLIGDAAYAPSFLTGQGTSLALVGAYMLAHALATNRTHTTALTTYETTTRPFITANQALVDNGTATLFPTTPEALTRRNTNLRSLTSIPTLTPRPEYTALALPGLPTARRTSSA
ncbi:MULTISPECIES: FAD-dependent monooxygenase [Glycomyces]|uniref:2-polyprenyl-6-methoxyphenol hydroxylase-like FAD-dependent oxidoreductase n=2 Tax=Glycomyces TaxID=58113 RepID=A0A9X3PLE8_9ACTN|nr:FAD-dependent monooxygenase [Glycomyces lechevalierae]MDA1385743.1 FAD-dependent monooxygenase [Glycomyces lechevalierae]MDR7339863.1 2-polyprenyl-6-methoxyphenol hydroxylase-like FAD-dependent oxidoreductase [Glycomyces lechevalierae]